MWRTFRQVLALFIAISIGVLLCGGEASAATVTIWPDQFSVDNWEVDGPPTFQNPDHLTGSAHYSYILKVPVGKTVRFIRVNYNSPYSFCVYLRRKTPSTEAETLINFAPVIVLPEGTNSLQSDATHVTGPLRIRHGYRYYIQLEPGIEDGSINSVQVVYN